MQFTRVPEFRSDFLVFRGFSDILSVWVILGYFVEVLYKSCSQVSFVDLFVMFSCLWSCSSCALGPRGWAWAGVCDPLPRTDRLEPPPPNREAWSLGEGDGEP